MDQANKNIEYRLITDKFDNGFEHFYSRILNPYKDKNINFLEIGFLNGGSLLYFQDMLPNANIFGLDILERPESLKHFPEIKTFEINQNDTEALVNLATENKFEIIIDDGSHYTKETKNCFDSLWDLLNPGGLYIIEDWAVAFHPSFRYDITEGMSDLIFDIAKRKNELGISHFEITIEENWCSRAMFKKEAK